MLTRKSSIAFFALFFITSCGSIDLTKKEDNDKKPATTQQFQQAEIKKEDVQKDKNDGEAPAKENAFIATDEENKTDDSKSTDNVANAINNVVAAKSDNKDSSDLKSKLDKILSEIPKVNLNCDGTTSPNTTGKPQKWISGSAKPVGFTPYKDFIPDDGWWVPEACFVPRTGTATPAPKDTTAEKKDP